MEDTVDTKKKVEELEKRINVLEWDKTRNQINPSKLAQLEDLKKELISLTSIKDIEEEQ